MIRCAPSDAPAPAAVPGAPAELLRPPAATGTRDPAPPDVITVQVERLPTAGAAPPIGWTPGAPAWGPGGPYPPSYGGGTYPAPNAGGAYPAPHGAVADPTAYTGGAYPPVYAPGGYPAYQPYSAAVTSVATTWRRTEPLAVASAICGFTAFVPVLSQIIGLVLGIAGLLRIRRARRNGVPLRGALWAWMGIGSSGFVLLCWLAVFAAFVAIGASFRHTASALDHIMPNPH